jgi:hypothetical protein
MYWRRNVAKQKREMYDIHHRKPRSLGGDNSAENTVKVRKNAHRAWHLLFGNADPYMIANIINSVFIDPDYEFEVKKK